MIFSKKICLEIFISQGILVINTYHLNTAIAHHAPRSACVATLMSRSVPTLTIPRASRGSTKFLCTNARGPGKFFLTNARGPGKSYWTNTRGPGILFSALPSKYKFIVSDIVNCFNIWYSEGTQRISDTFNTF